MALASDRFGFYYVEWMVQHRIEFE